MHDNATLTCSCSIRLVSSSLSVCIPTDSLVCPLLHEIWLIRFFYLHALSWTDKIALRLKV